MAGRCDVSWRLWDVARQDMSFADIEVVDLQYAFMNCDVIGCDTLGKSVAMIVVGATLDGQVVEVKCNSHYSPSPVIEVFTMRVIVKED